MALTTTIGDRTRTERKLLAVSLLRELAALLLSQAETMEQSPICSADWPALHLQGAQAACGLWQRRAGEYIHAWEIEDFELRQPLPPDL